MVKAARKAEALPEFEHQRRARPIDLVHLSRQSLGDPGLEQEILRMYAQIAHGYFDKMRDCDDLNEIAHCLHSLKGSSAGVGAMQVFAAAKEAETAFQVDGKLDTELVADLHIHLTEASDYIASILSE